MSERVTIESLEGLTEVVVDLTEWWECPFKDGEKWCNLHYALTGKAMSCVGDGIPEGAACKCQHLPVLVKAKEE